MVQYGSANYKGFSFSTHQVVLSMERGGVPPTTKTAYITVRSAVNAGRLDVAEKWAQYMQASGVRLNSTTLRLIELGRERRGSKLKWWSKWIDLKSQWIFLWISLMHKNFLSRSDLKVSGNCHGLGFCVSTTRQLKSQLSSWHSSILPHIFSMLARMGRRGRLMKFTVSLSYLRNLKKLFRYGERAADGIYISDLYGNAGGTFSA